MIKIHYVKKGKKYLFGHSYSSHSGYSFSWTPYKVYARTFTNKEDALHFAHLTKGKVE